MEVSNPQLDSIEFPPALYQRLQRKLADQIFDAGDNFAISAILSEDEAGGATTRLVVVTAEDGLKAEGDVFLVDHAWTFPPGSARESLLSYEPLLRRMAALMGVGSLVGSTEDDVEAAIEGRAGEREGQVDAEALLDGVLSALPTFSRNYNLGGPGKDLFYVLDEFGSAFRHNDKPSFKMAPYLYPSPDGPIGFSLVWPIREVEKGEEATVDLLQFTAWGGVSPVARNTVLWGLGHGFQMEDSATGDGGNPVDGTPRGNLPSGVKQACQQRLEKRKWRLDVWAREFRRRVGEAGDASVFAGATEQWTAAQGVRPSQHVGSMLEEGRKVRLRVWQDRDWLVGLNRPEFELMTGGLPADADIIWAASSTNAAFKDVMGGLHPGKVTNRFPYEGALVNKDDLARTIMREFGNSAAGSFLQPTYDLQDEDDLMAFVADFVQREEAQGEGGAGAGEENIWIVKPTALARSLGTTVTQSLANILRAVDTGPKVAQLYISRPLLWQGRKFDLRFVALLRAASPPPGTTELYVYDVFWVRAAQNMYSTNRPSDLEDPHTSLTAMHLLGGEEGTHPDHKEFVEEMRGILARDHPNLSWEDILGRIRSMIRSVFLAASRQQPGMSCPHARAVYGCDVMLTGDMQPRLLEVTFSPANLASSPAFPVQYPSYLDDLFGCLFLGEQKNVTRLA